MPDPFPPSTPAPADLLPLARESAHRRARRVRDAWFPILLTAIAGALAWALARLIVGQAVPFFAPVTAVICLGVSRGQSLRKAIEISLGVVLGILVADLLVRVVGSGTVQVAVLIGATMAVALYLDEGVLFINQASISAVLVMALPASGSAQGTPTDRFFDALIGGAVAIVLSQVLLPRDPLQDTHAALRGLRDALAGTLRDVASALRAGDRAGAARALERSRSLDARVAAVGAAADAARDRARWSPPRRQVRERLRAYDESLRHVDYAVRNTRVLARVAATALRRRHALEPELAAAIDALADGIDGLEAVLAEPPQPDATRAAARRAIDGATPVLAAHHDLSTAMIVGQVRGTAHDLLRASGVQPAETAALLDATLEDVPEAAPGA
jgi:uncharacterized membrane protein YgaE (UPF0421/DUF939 family)